MNTSLELSVDGRHSLPDRFAEARRSVNANSHRLSLGGNKIQPHHLERQAVVYVRQSTAQQVLDHRESRELQYKLADRAVDLGWSRERVLVIDDDQAQTASTIEGRLGFQRLLAEVSLNHVGPQANAIAVKRPMPGIEVSSTASSLEPQRSSITFSMSLSLCWMCSRSASK